MPRLRALDPETLFAALAGCERIGLAVSGGPDSLALLLLVSEWVSQTPQRPQVFVYSVDHGLRPEAAAEAAGVVREAERRGFIARVLRWHGTKPGSGLQAAARQARYRLLAAAAREDRLEVVLTGHHLGDQAETVLMRLAHGSGIDGLAGMRQTSFVEGCRVLRPLLDVHPDALRDVVAAASLTAVMDPSNADPAYERVRWRQFQPQLDAMGLTLERFGTLARRLELAAMLVADKVEEAYPRIVTPLSETDYELAHGRFSTLNPLVATSLLGQVMGLVKGDRSAPPLAPLESLVARLQSFDAVKRATLHGCILSSDGETLITVRREGPRRAASKKHAELVEPPPTSPVDAPTD